MSQLSCTSNEPVASESPEDLARFSSAGAGVLQVPAPWAIAPSLAIQASEVHRASYFAFVGCRGANKFSLEPPGPWLEGAPCPSSFGLVSFLDVCPACPGRPCNAAWSQVPDAGGSAVG